MKITNKDIRFMVNETIKRLMKEDRSWTEMGSLGITLSEFIDDTDSEEGMALYDRFENSSGDYYDLSARRACYEESQTWDYPGYSETGDMDITDWDGLDKELSELEKTYPEFVKQIEDYIYDEDNWDWDEDEPDPDYYRD